MSAAIQHPGPALERTRRAVLDAYAEKSAGSARLYARAAQSLAGGTTGNLRHFFPHPLYFAHGEGGAMVDVDGNRYVDCFLCNGPLLLGHRHPRIVSAIRESEHIGSLVVNPPLAVDVAEKLRQVVPCAEKVRFLNSGTEAVLTAVRLARAFTGRSSIVKFLGHYHGQDDQFLVGLDSQGTSFGAGIPETAHRETLLVKYDDASSLLEALNHDREVAAIILDPAMHSGGLWGSRPEYLRALRALTRERDILLIFDEVITGFRLAPGGAQAFHGVTPDLATFGKALAAGEKLAAVAGRADVLAGLDAERAPGVAAVFQSGTGNDGTAALAAANAAIATYSELDAQGGYRKLAALSASLASGIREAFAARGLPCHVNQLGPMLQLFLSDAKPDFATFSKLDPAPLALFYLALINEGVLLSLPTSNHVYLSFAHTRADVDFILEKVATVLDTHDFAPLLGH